MLDVHTMPCNTCTSITLRLETLILSNKFGESNKL